MYLRTEPIVVHCNFLSSIKYKHSSPFREGIVIFYEAVRSRFPEDARRAVPRLLFTQFFCKLIENPKEYMITEKGIKNACFI